MLTPSTSAELPICTHDPLTAERQLHFICEGWKKGLDFEGLRRLVVRFYGAERKPYQLHWTEVDRLIIEIWLQDIRKDTHRERH
jgi:hypothetical protein